LRIAPGDNLVVLDDFKAVWKVGKLPVRRFLRILVKVLERRSQVGSVGSK
jgi:hypothetical protein